MRVRIAITQLQDATGEPTANSDVPRHLVFANFALGHEAAFKSVDLTIGTSFTTMRKHCARIIDPAHSS